MSAPRLILNAHRVFHDEFYSREDGNASGTVFSDHPWTPKTHSEVTGNI